MLSTLLACLLYISKLLPKPFARSLPGLAQVVYTPLRLCSVYAAVNGAVATGAALVDRQRTNLGRELLVSRLANGIAAIGALSLTIDGPNLPAHLISTPISHIRQGADPDEFEAIRKEATKDPAKQLWLERRLYPVLLSLACCCILKPAAGHLVLGCLPDSIS